jgi:hypothetical protein
VLDVCLSRQEIVLSIQGLLQLLLAPSFIKVHEFVKSWKWVFVQHFLNMAYHDTTAVANAIVWDLQHQFKLLLQTNNAKTHIESSGMLKFAIIHQIASLANHNSYYNFSVGKTSALRLWDTMMYSDLQQSTIDRSFMTDMWHVDKWPMATLGGKKERQYQGLIHVEHT